MNIYQILCLIGIPSLIASGINLVFNKIGKSKNDSKIIKKSVQALLRAQMISDYNKWSKQEYAPIYAHENFENCWNLYHQLGENGVMNGIHDSFSKLPTEPASK